MKRDLSWHYDCLQNRIASRDRLLEELSSINSSIDGLNNSIHRYALQIDRAIREGKTEFDRERFKV